MSDAHLLGGYRRLTWIWVGRALMALSLFSLGLATATLARGAANPALLWLAITISLLLFSFGVAVSGSTFLALLHDRARAEQRGRAVGLVWTFLLLGFTLGGILFSIMLPSGDEGSSSLDPGRLAQVFVVAALVLGGLCSSRCWGKRNGIAVSKRRLPQRHPFAPTCALSGSNRARAGSSST